MKPKSAILLASGLLLLALAAWLVPTPRPNPRPDLPEIAPFSAGERIALFLPTPDEFPPPDTLALVRRARAAGAEVRVFTPGDSLAAYAPDRIYQPCLGPDTPNCYHPDQWPARPPGDTALGNDWQMLVLTPEEIAVKNTAVLVAARVLRDSGIADPQGARESALLSRARRAELYLALHPGP
jgi:hypothetical protein